MADEAYLSSCGVFSTEGVFSSLGLKSMWFAGHFAACHSNCVYVHLELSWLCEQGECSMYAGQLKCTLQPLHFFSYCRYWRQRLQSSIAVPYLNPEGRCWSSVHVIHGILVVSSTNSMHRPMDGTKTIIAQSQACQADSCFCTISIGCMFN